MATEGSGVGGGSKGRVALVTGSVRGLGLAVARRLRVRGDRVHVVHRSGGARAEALGREFPDAIHRADLLDEGAAGRLVEEVLEREGRLDYAVHAVGDYASGPLRETSVDDLRRLLSSNVESAFLFFDAVRDALRSGAGRAVFFGCGGLAGLRGRREAAAYAAAKSALLVLVRGWALEEAPHGVTVNMVSPGHVPHDAAHGDTLDPERLSRIPMGRPGRPQDVAAAVAWLCSDEAGYTTGSDLLVSGGWML